MWHKFLHKTGEPGGVKFRALGWNSWSNKPTDERSKHENMDKG
jgi:hypothetical protein